MIQAKNLTGSDVSISDLSLEFQKIPANSTVNLSDSNTIFEIQTSKDLLDAINQSKVVLIQDNIELSLIESSIIFQESYSGNYLLNFERESLSSTTSYSYKVLGSIYNEELPLGNYKLHWYCEIQNSSTSGRHCVKVSSSNEEVNDKNIDDGTTIGEIEVEPKDKNNWYPFSGSKVIQNTSESSFHFAISHKTTRGTAYIRRVRLSLWRIG